MRSEVRKSTKVAFVNGTEARFMFMVIKPFETTQRRTGCAMFFTLTKWWLSNGAFLLILFLSILATTPGSAQQVLQTNRYETPVGRNEYFEVMPSQEDGI